MCIISDESSMKNWKSFKGVKMSWKSILNSLKCHLTFAIVFCLSGYRNIHTVPKSISLSKNLNLFFNFFIFHFFSYFIYFFSYFFSLIFGKNCSFRIVCRHENKKFIFAKLVVWRENEFFMTIILLRASKEVVDILSSIPSIHHIIMLN